MTVDLYCPKFQKLAFFFQVVPLSTRNYKPMTERSNYPNYFYPGNDIITKRRVKFQKGISLRD